MSRMWDHSAILHTGDDTGSKLPPPSCYVNDSYFTSNTFAQNDDYQSINQSMVLSASCAGHTRT